MAEGKPMETENRDYKYFMQDTGSVYLGANLSYAEILRDEMVNFKYKSIVEHYIFKDTDPETTLESHLYYMTKEQFSYRTYEQLRAKVKVSILEDKKTFFGKKKTGYATKLMPLAALADMNLAQKKAKGVVIQELALSKLGLMAFSV
ncbi:MAG: hypothetical protein K2M20_14940 [Lachnospiraceae bacterium]|nr:hypothetical protein [Lachnospiraceae bacterium]